jgi:hypothetical protein
MSDNNASNVTLIACVIASMVTSSVIDWRGINRFRPVFQPRGAAFSLWGLLFSISLLHGVLTFSQEDAELETLERTITWWTAVAYTFCALWPFAVANEFYKLAALVLIGGASSAWTATAACTMYAMKDVRSVAIALSPSLLAGWLTAAASIGVVFALGPESRFNTIETFLTVVTAASVASILLRAPGAAGALTWAAFWAQPSPFVCNAPAFASLLIAGISFVYTIASRV